MNTNKNNIVGLFLACEQCRMGLDYYTRALQYTKSQDEKERLIKKIEHYKKWLPIFEAELDEINKEREAAR